jgi:hypothetical protein
MSEYFDITPGSGDKVAALSFTDPIDTTAKKAERVVPATGKSNFPTTPQISKQNAAGLYPTTAVDIQGQGRVGLRFTMSASNVSVAFQVLLYDDDGTLYCKLPAPGDSYTAVASSIESFTEESETRYLGSFFLLSNESGAESLKVRFTGAPTNSGTVSVFVAGV